MMTVEPILGGKIKFSVKAKQSLPAKTSQSLTFGYLPMGMNRPSSIIGKLLPKPVGKAHMRCPSSLASSAIVNMSTCKITIARGSQHSQAAALSGRQPGILSIELVAQDG